MSSECLNLTNKLLNKFFWLVSEATLPTLGWWTVLILCPCYICIILIVVFTHCCIVLSLLLTAAAKPHGLSEIVKPSSMIQQDAVTCTKGNSIIPHINTNSREPLLEHGKPRLFLIINQASSDSTRRVSLHDAVKSRMCVEGLKHTQP